MRLFNGEEWQRNPLQNKFMKNLTLVRKGRPFLQDEKKVFSPLKNVD